MDYGRFAPGYSPTMRVVTVVPPAVEPVTLAEAKRWLRVDSSDDDADIAALIVEAREKVEADSGVALITQVKTAFIAGFRSLWGDVNIPYPPLQSVSSVKFLDMGGTLLTIDPTTYVSQAGSIPARLWVPLGRSWPITGPYPDAVQVTYVCGFGDSADAVPMAAKMALRSRLVTTYLYRPGTQFLQGGQMDDYIYESYIRQLSYGRYS